MKSLLFAGAVTVLAGMFNTGPDALFKIYEDVFPNDPVKRQALQLCFSENHNFNRIDGAARAECYRHALGERTAQEEKLLAAAIAARAISINEVDLRRAAGRGSAPRNDVRIQEETRKYVAGPKSTTR